MGQYWTEHKGYIQSELAYRLGVVVRQYERLVEDDDPLNFNSSLFLSVLQTLLTTCKELIEWNDYTFSDKKPNDGFYDLDTTISLVNQFGFHKNMIKESEFSKDRTNCKHVLNHLRNAMSHPTISTESKDQTGYTSMGGDSLTDRITGYQFINVSQYNGSKFRIEMTTEELRNLIFSLSKLLAQPYQKKNNPRWEADFYNENIFDAA